MKQNLKIFIHTVILFFKGIDLKPAQDFLVSSKNVLRGKIAPLKDRLLEIPYIRDVDFKSLKIRRLLSLAISPVTRTSAYLGTHKNISYHILSFDLAVVFFAIPIALFLRIGPEIVDYTLAYVFKLSLVYTLCCFSFYTFFGTHHVLWRYFDSDDAIRFIVSLSLATLFFSPLKKLMSITEELPRLTILLGWITVLVTSLTPRFITYFQHHKTKQMHKEKVSLLIFGTDDRTEVFLKQLQQMEDIDYNIIGLVSLRPDEVGMEIHHVDVVTSLKDFWAWLSRNPGTYKMLVIERHEGAMEILFALAHTWHIPLLKIPRSFIFEECSDLSSVMDMIPINAAPASQKVS